MSLFVTGIYEYSTAAVLLALGAVEQKGKGSGLALAIEKLEVFVGEKLLQEVERKHWAKGWDHVAGA